MGTTTAYDTVHCELIDAALALNEGGTGQMKNGKYLINEVQASEKVYSAEMPSGVG